MTDFAIQRLERPNDKLRQAPQAKVTLLHSCPPSPWLPRPLPAQLLPDIQQHKTQADQQKAIRRILARRPPPHLARTSIAALDAKAFAIGALDRLRLHLDIADQQVGQPLHLRPPFLRLFDLGPIERHLHCDLLLFAAKVIAGDIALLAHAQGLETSLAAAQRTGDDRLEAAATQELDDRDGGKAAVQIEARNLDFQGLYAFEEEAKNLRVGLFCQHKLDRQGEAAAAEDDIGGRHAVDARGALFGFAAHPEALVLLAFAIVGLVVIIDGDLERAKPEQEVGGRRQSRIDRRFDSRQLFGVELLVEALTKGGGTGDVGEIGAQRLQRVARGGDAKQEVKQLGRGAGVAVGLEAEMRS